MENSFINSVHRFIQSLNLEYELKDGIFYFHKNKIIIIPLLLNYLNSLSISSLDIIEIICLLLGYHC